METHQQIFERCKDLENVCVTCGNPLPEDTSLWDEGHVLNPKTRGGEDTWAQCVECNAKQGNQTLEEWDANGDVGIRNADPIRTLIDLRTTIQKQYLRWNNRKIASTRTTDSPDAMTDKYVEVMHDMIKGIDKDIKKQIREVSVTRPIFEHVMSIKGIAEVMAAQLICQIDIKRSEHASSLHKFAGYAPGFDKMVKGERRPFNRNLRTICYKIGVGFMRCKSPYRAIYDKAKADFALKHPEYKKGHLHNHGIRVMMKIFLAHLWLTWRKLEGLPTDSPYPIAYLGHTGYYDPKEFGWGGGL